MYWVAGQTPPRIKEFPHMHTRARTHANKAQTERKAPAVEDSGPLFPHMDTSITRRVAQQAASEQRPGTAFGGRGF